MYCEELMEKHFLKIKECKPSAKKGLICYTYNDGIKEEGYYNPVSMNMGDYIQSLATRQFFSSIDEYVDRDRLKEYDKDKIDMIMNGWYVLWKRNEVFSEKINPLFVSFHLNNTENISQKTLNYLKKHEPIGCRDYATADFLKQNSIEAYFSGCMTLTLGKTYALPFENKLNEIYFVDYQLGDNPILDKHLEKVLKEYKGHKIYYKTHMYPLSKDVEGCLQEAETIIKTYSKAKLVITKNIHCALPCLAIGTPVILMVPYYDTKRFQGIFEFFNHIGYDEANKLSVILNFSKDAKIINPEKHYPYRDFLINICEEFAKEKSTFKPFKENNFKDKQGRSKKYKRNPYGFIFKKIKNGNKRTVVFFNLIKISYIKKG